MVVVVANPSLLNTAANLERTALLVAQALAHIRQELSAHDGYPTSTMSDGSPGGSAELTSVEAAAVARVALGRHAGTIYDLVESLYAGARLLAEVCRDALGTRVPRVEVPVCDGSGYEGATVVWTPYSHSPANGWHDPFCKDAADDSGLCPRCRLRERRWRAEHGHDPRYSNGGAAGATVAA